MTNNTFELIGSAAQRVVEQAKQAMLENMRGRYPTTFTEEDIRETQRRCGERE